MKKILKIIGLLSLVCFSFVYTNQISAVVKDNDNIIGKLKDVQEQYKVLPIDAVIDGNTIIPGLSGSEIDINSSYKKMKKINSFNDSLIVYRKIKPNISVNKVYDKYIVSGNKHKNDVALVFTLENEDVSDILKTLDMYNIKATFFVSSIWFEKYEQLIIDLIGRGHTIGNMGYFYNYNHDSIDWMNAITTKVANQKNTFCYNICDDATSLDICNSNKSYTIRPSITVKSNPLIEIKKNITNGSIISLNVNDTTVKELPLVLNYIKSKGFNMVTIEDLINE